MMLRSPPRIVAPYHRLRLLRSQPALTPLSARRPALTPLPRRSYAALAPLPKPGHSLHGFTLHRAEHVPELQLSALHYTHDRTGADYLHVAADDANNVFSIAFKTNPPDATGVPHILEHVTLCGSEKYPVRDPFFKMLPRSLQNFMNAFTSADYTMYPFATTNAQDFKNLMSVYLDATLHPLLQPSDFVQEGWRVGPENPSAAAATDSSDLVFKGVVYNEMKGQMSDATYLFYIRFMQHIFPDINNSGGDPQNITDLTYDQLRNFHRNHYHPSNSKIMTYGNQPVEEHLRMLGEQLARFGKLDVDQDLKSPIPLRDGPKHVTLSGPVDPLTPPDAQFKTSTTWLMGDTSDISESFALRIATSLLLDGYGAPLYRALVESGLGTDYTPNTGYDTSARVGIFSIGLNGVAEANVAQVHSVMAETIRETIDRGLDKQKVDGMLHQLELALKHRTAAFGMDLVSRLNPGWFNGLDPFDMLAWNAVVDRFKESYAQGGYLEGLLRKYLLTENTMTFTMTPSPSFAGELAAEEAARLQSKIQEAVQQHPSAEEAYQELRQRELALVDEQDAGRGQPLDCLPTLHVADISRTQEPTVVRDSVVGATTKVQWRETSTNGLTYFRALSLFTDLPDELRMLVPLFCDSLLRIGTKDKTIEQLEDLIKLKTGGIHFGYHASTSPDDIHQAEEGFSISGYTLDRNVAAFYELIHTLLVETDFDSPNAHQMIRQLLQSGASGAVDGIAESGHAYASRYAASGLTPYGRMVEQTSGLTQVKLIIGLASAEHNAAAMHALVQQLRAIQALAVRNLTSSSMRVALTCGADAVSTNEHALTDFLSTLSTTSLLSTAPLSSPLSSSSSSPLLSLPAPSRKAFFALPYQVSYTGLALSTDPYTSAPSAARTILAQLLTHRHLHHEIREKGGAYGASASSRALAGSFAMSSYRDPNPANSLAIMRTAARWAAARPWSARDLQEAKLATFQAVDAPESVAQEGMLRFTTGIAPATEQLRRERLLDVTADDVRAVADQLADQLAARLDAGHATTVVLGDAQKHAALLQDHADGPWAVHDLAATATAADA